MQCYCHPPSHAPSLSPCVPEHSLLALCPYCAGVSAQGSIKSSSKQTPTTSNQPRLPSTNVPPGHSAANFYKRPPSVQHGYMAVSSQQRTFVLDQTPCLCEGNHAKHTLSNPCGSTPPANLHVGRLPSVSYAPPPGPRPPVCAKVGKPHPLPRPTHSLLPLAPPLLRERHLSLMSVVPFSRAICLAIMSLPRPAAVAPPPRLAPSSPSLVEIAGENSRRAWVQDATLSSCPAQKPCTTHPRARPGCSIPSRRPGVSCAPDGDARGARPRQRNLRVGAKWLGC